MPAGRSRLRGREHHRRGIPAAAPRGGPDHVSAVRPAARGSPRDRIRLQRPDPRRGRREVDAPDARASRDRRARSCVHRRQRLRGRGRRHRHGRAGTRHRRTRAAVARQTAAPLRRPTAGRPRCWPARRVRGAGGRRAGEAQGAGRRRRRVHGAEPVREQLGTRERESATRAVRGHQDRECAYALHRYGGRDRGAGRRNKLEHEMVQWMEGR